MSSYDSREAKESSFGDTRKTLPGYQMGISFQLREGCVGMGGGGELVVVWF